MALWARLFLRGRRGRVLPPSLLALRAVNQMKSTLSLPVTLEMLFLAHDLADLAARLPVAQRDTDTADLHALDAFMDELLEADDE